MRLAERTQHIAAFQVMEIVKRAHALSAQGHSIIHMSIGEPDFGAAPAVRRAMASIAADRALPYTGATGIEPLRNAISEHYKKHYAVEVTPERILVTAGASAALTLACSALVNPGDRVMMTDPSYPCNRHFVAAFNGTAQLVPVGANTRYQLNAELVARNWTSDTKGILLATPSNPTGTSIEPAEMHRILDFVAQKQAYSIVDEIYGGLSYREQSIEKPKANTALSLRNDIVVTNSFSKYFGMTGWRLGWMVVPSDMVSDFEKLAQNLYICPSTPAQYAALECFTDESMGIFEERRQEFQARRDFLVPALKALGFEIPVIPDGAFYVYANCSALSSNSHDFAMELLDKAHVCIVPGTDFGNNKPEQFLRFSYATKLDQLQLAVDRIASFIQSR